MQTQTTTVPKFKTGDTVRVVKNPIQSSATAGEVFTVEGVERLPRIRRFGGYWYRGDHAGFGVWEENLEAVV